MKWLDELWPEWRFSCYDCPEKTVSCPINANTQLVTGNPYRTGIFFGASNATSPVGVSTRSTAVTPQGFNFSTQNLFLQFWGDEIVPLAAQPWFAVTGAGTVVITVLEVILQRPIVRPPEPIQRVAQAGGTLADNLELAKLLRKQQKWRRKVQNLLQEGTSNGKKSGGTGSRMAAPDTGGLRFFAGGLPKAGPVPPIFTRRG